MACRDKSEIWAGKTAERTALFGLLAASAIGAAAGARFYEHYYVQLIPPLALLAAPYYARLWSRNDAAAPLVITTFGDLRVVGAHHCCLLNLALDWRWLRDANRRRRDDICSSILPQTTGFSSGAISPKIYLEARRRPACRYIISFPLTGSCVRRTDPGF